MLFKTLVEQAIFSFRYDLKKLIASLKEGLTALKAILLQYIMLYQLQLLITKIKEISVAYLVERIGVKKEIKKSFRIEYSYLTIEHVCRRVNYIYYYNAFKKLFRVNYIYYYNAFKKLFRVIYIYLQKSLLNNLSFNLFTALKRYADYITPNFKVYYLASLIFIHKGRNKITKSELVYYDNYFTQDMGTDIYYKALDVKSPDIVEDLYQDVFIWNDLLAMVPFELKVLVSLLLSFLLGLRFRKTVKIWQEKVESSKLLSKLFPKLTTMTFTQIRWELIANVVLYTVIIYYTFNPVGNYSRLNKSEFYHYRPTAFRTFFKYSPMYQEVFDREFNIYRPSKGNEPDRELADDRSFNDLKREIITSYVDFENDVAEGATVLNVIAVDKNKDSFLLKKNNVYSLIKSNSILSYNNPNKIDPEEHERLLHELFLITNKFSTANYVEFLISTYLSGAMVGTSLPSEVSIASRVFSTGNAKNKPPLSLHYGVYLARTGQSYFKYDIFNHPSHSQRIANYDLPSTLWSEEYFEGALNEVDKEDFTKLNLASFLDFPVYKFFEYESVLEDSNGPDGDVNGFYDWHDEPEFAPGVLLTEPRRIDAYTWKESFFANCVLPSGNGWHQQRYGQWGKVFHCGKPNRLNNFGHDWKGRYLWFVYPYFNIHSTDILGDLGSAESIPIAPAYMIAGHYPELEIPIEEIITDIERVEEANVDEFIKVSPMNATFGPSVRIFHSYPQEPPMEPSNSLNNFTPETQVLGKGLTTDVRFGLDMFRNYQLFKSLLENELGGSEILDYFFSSFFNILHGEEVIPTTDLKHPLEHLKNWPTILLQAMNIPFFSSPKVKDSTQQAEGVRDLSFKERFLIKTKTFVYDILTWLDIKSLVKNHHLLNYYYEWFESFFIVPSALSKEDIFIESAINKIEDILFSIELHEQIQKTDHSKNITKNFAVWQSYDIYHDMLVHFRILPHIYSLQGNPRSSYYYNESFFKELYNLTNWKKLNGASFMSRAMDLTKLYITDKEILSNSEGMLNYNYLNHGSNFKDTLALLNRSVLKKLYVGASMDLKNDMPRTPITFLEKITEYEDYKALLLKSETDRGRARNEMLEEYIDMPNYEDKPMYQYGRVGEKTYILAQDPLLQWQDILTYNRTNLQDFSYYAHLIKMDLLRRDAYQYPLEMDYINWMANNPYNISSLETLPTLAKFINTRYYNIDFNPEDILIKDCFSFEDLYTSNNIPTRILPKRSYYRKLLEIEDIYRRYNIISILENSYDSDLSEKIDLFATNEVYSKLAINTTYMDSQFYKGRFKYLLRDCQTSPSIIQYHVVLPWLRDNRQILADFSLASGPLGWHPTAKIPILSEAFPEGSLHPLYNPTIPEMLDDVDMPPKIGGDGDGVLDDDLALSTSHRTLPDTEIKDRLITEVFKVRTYKNHCGDYPMLRCLPPHKYFRYIDHNFSVLQAEAKKVNKEDGTKFFKYQDKYQTPLLINEIKRKKLSEKINYLDTSSKNLLKMSKLFRPLTEYIKGDILKLIFQREALFNTESLTSKDLDLILKNLSIKLFNDFRLSGHTEFFSYLLDLSNKKGSKLHFSILDAQFYNCFNKLIESPSDLEEFLRSLILGNFSYMTLNPIFHFEDILALGGDIGMKAKKYRVLHKLFYDVRYKDIKTYWGSSLHVDKTNILCLPIDPYQREIVNINDLDPQNFKLNLVDALSMSYVSNWTSLFDVFAEEGDFDATISEEVKNDIPFPQDTLLGQYGENFLIPERAYERPPCLEESLDLDDFGSDNLFIDDFDNPFASDYTLPQKLVEDYPGDEPYDEEHYRAIAYVVAYSNITPEYQHLFVEDVETESDQGYDEELENYVFSKLKADAEMENDRQIDKLYNDYMETSLYGEKPQDSHTLGPEIKTDGQQGGAALTTSISEEDTANLVEMSTDLMETSLFDVDEEMSTDLMETSLFDEEVLDNYTLGPEIRIDGHQGGAALTTSMSEQDMADMVELYHACVEQQNEMFGGLDDEQREMLGIEDIEFSEMFGMQRELYWIQHEREMEQREREIRESTFAIGGKDECENEMSDSAINPEREIREREREQIVEMYNDFMANYTPSDFNIDGTNDLEENETEDVYQAGYVVIPDNMYQHVHNRILETYITKSLEIRAKRDELEAKKAKEKAEHMAFLVDLVEEDFIESTGFVHLRRDKSTNEVVKPDTEEQNILVDSDSDLPPLELVSDIDSASVSSSTDTDTIVSFDGEVDYLANYGIDANNLDINFELWTTRRYAHVENTISAFSKYKNGTIGGYKVKGDLDPNKVVLAPYIRRRADNSFDIKYGLFLRHKYIIDRNEELYDGEVPRSDIAAYIKNLLKGELTCTVYGVNDDDDMQELYEEYLIYEGLQMFNSYRSDLIWMDVEGGVLDFDFFYGGSLDFKDYIVQNVISLEEEERSYDQVASNEHYLDSIYVPTERNEFIPVEWSTFDSYDISLYALLRKIYSSTKLFESNYNFNIYKTRFKFNPSLSFKGYNKFHQINKFEDSLYMGCESRVPYGNTKALFVKYIPQIYQRAVRKKDINIFDLSEQFKLDPIDGNAKAYSGPMETPIYHLNEHWTAFTRYESEASDQIVALGLSVVANHPDNLDNNIAFGWDIEPTVYSNNTFISFYKVHSEGSGVEDNSLLKDFNLLSLRSNLLNIDSPLVDQLMDVSTLDIFYNEPSYADLTGVKESLFKLMLLSNGSLNFNINIDFMKNVKPIIPGLHKPSLPLLDKDNLVSSFIKNSNNLMLNDERYIRKLHLPYSLGEKDYTNVVDDLLQLIALNPIYEGIDQKFKADLVGYFLYRIKRGDYINYAMLTHVLSRKMNVVYDEYNINMYDVYVRKFAAAERSDSYIIKWLRVCDFYDHCERILENEFLNQESLAEALLLRNNFHDILFSHYKVANASDLSLDDKEFFHRIKSLLLETINRVVASDYNISSYPVEKELCDYFPNAHILESSEVYDKRLNDNFHVIIVLKLLETVVKANEKLLLNNKLLSQLSYYLYKDFLSQNIKPPQFLSYIVDCTPYKKEILKADPNSFRDSITLNPYVEPIKDFEALSTNGIIDMIRYSFYSIMSISRTEDFLTPDLLYIFAIKLLEICEHYAFDVSKDMKGYLLQLLYVNFSAIPGRLKEYIMLSVIDDDPFSYESLFYKSLYDTFIKNIDKCNEISVYDFGFKKSLRTSPYKNHFILGEKGQCLALHRDLVNESEGKCMATLGFQVTEEKEMRDWAKTIAGKPFDTAQELMDETEGGKYKHQGFTLQYDQNQLIMMPWGKTLKTLSRTVYPFAYGDWKRRYLVLNYGESVNRLIYGSLKDLTTIAAPTIVNELCPLYKPTRSSLEKYNIFYFRVVENLIKSRTLLRTKQPADTQTGYEYLYVANIEDFFKDPEVKEIKEKEVSTIEAEIIKPDLKDLGPKELDNADTAHSVEQNIRNFNSIGSVLNVIGIVNNYKKDQENINNAGLNVGSEKTVMTSPLELHEAGINKVLQFSKGVEYLLLELIVGLCEQLIVVHNHKFDYSSHKFICSFVHYLHINDYIVPEFFIKYLASKGEVNPGYLDPLRISDALFPYSSKALKIECTPSVMYDFMYYFLYKLSTHTVAMPDYLKNTFMKWFLRYTDLLSDKALPFEAFRYVMYTYGVAEPDYTVPAQYNSYIYADHCSKLQLIGLYSNEPSEDKQKLIDNLLHFHNLLTFNAHDNKDIKSPNYIQLIETICAELIERNAQIPYDTWYKLYKLYKNSSLQERSQFKLLYYILAQNKEYIKLQYFNFQNTNGFMGQFLRDYSEIAVDTSELSYKIQHFYNNFLVNIPDSGFRNIDFSVEEKLKFFPESGYPKLNVLNPIFEYTMKSVNPFVQALKKHEEYKKLMGNLQLSEISNLATEDRDQYFSIYTSSPILWPEYAKTYSTLPYSIQYVNKARRVGYMPVEAYSYKRSKMLSEMGDAEALRARTAYTKLDSLLAKYPPTMQEKDLRSSYVWLIEGNYSNFWKFFELF